MVNNFESTQYWEPFLSRSRRARAFVGDMLTPPIEEEAVVSTLTPVNSENAMSLVPKFTNQILSGPGLKCIKKFLYSRTPVIENLTDNTVRFKSDQVTEVLNETIVKPTAHIGESVNLVKTVSSVAEYLSYEATVHDLAVTATSVASSILPS